ncbi:MAG: LPXTG cell wall anchor domain-containing protein [Oscillospiraceae bacterium]|nr:LPXTG cell wall anchor domain-containing protein [Oscillospiraceae bacterium]
MKIKNVILIMICVLLCLLNFTKVNASLVQIPNSNNDISHIDVIDPTTGYTLPNTGVNNNNILIVAIVLILISTIYSYKKIKDYKDIF